eukprot:459053-Rhodomonas_salina.1
MSKLQARRVLMRWKIFETGDDLEDTMPPPSQAEDSTDAGESTCTVDSEPEGGDPRQPLRSAAKAFTCIPTTSKGERECEAFKARRRSDSECCCAVTVNLSNPDASLIEARSYLVCDRAASDGARGEQALGVKLEMKPGWTVDKGVARYRREKMSSAELAKYGFDCRSAAMHLCSLELRSLCQARTCLGTRSWAGE